MSNIEKLLQNKGFDYFYINENVYCIFSIKKNNSKPKFIIYIDNEWWIIGGILQKTVKVYEKPFKLEEWITWQTS